jgi:hypothetical protein
VAVRLLPERVAVHLLPEHVAVRYFPEHAGVRYLLPRRSQRVNRHGKVNLLVIHAKTRFISPHQGNKHDE